MSYSPAQGTFTRSFHVMQLIKGLVWNITFNPSKTAVMTISNQRNI